MFYANNITAAMPCLSQMSEPCFLILQAVVQAFSPCPAHSGLDCFWEGILQRHLPHFKGIHKKLRQEGLAGAYSS